MVRLRQRTFRHSAHATEEEAIHYFRTIFFENPWHDPALPSLVCESDAGRIIGFLGRITRRFQFAGTPIRAVTPTQLSAEGDASGLVALRLLREMLAGPQDLAWADAATERVRQIWMRIGGEVPAIQCLHWRFAVRPSGSALAGLEGGFVTRGTRFASQVLLRDADRAIARRIRHEAAQLQMLPSPSPESWLEAFRSLAEDALCTADGPAELSWTLRMLEAAHGPRAIRSAIAKDRRGKVVGAHMFVAKRNQVGEVIALAARRGAGGALMWALAGEALDMGIRTLRGRLEPRLAFELEALPVRIVREAPWSLFATSRPDLAVAIHSGRTQFTRLDGEWWLQF